MNLPKVTVIGLIVAVVGVLMTVIGLSTSTWLEGTDCSTTRGGTVCSDTYSSGLFKACTKRSGQLTDCVSYPKKDALPPDWIDAVKAMGILGVLLGVTCVMTLILYIVKRHLKILHLLGMGCAFAAGFFVLVGIIICAASRPATYFEIPLHLGWSFALTVVGSVAFGIAGGIILIAKLRGTTEPGTTEPGTTESLE